MAKRRPEGGEAPAYDASSELFSLAIHHEGLMIGNGIDMNYIDGKLDFFDKCDMDRMPIPIVEDLVEELGFVASSNLQFFWCYAGKQLCNGLIRLKSDSDMNVMTSAAIKNMMLDLYVVENFVVDEDTPGHGEGDTGSYCSEDEQEQDPAGEKAQDGYFVDSDYKIEDDDNLFENFVDVQIDEERITAHEWHGGKSVEDEEEGRDSEYGDSEELESVDSSSDEDINTKQRKRLPTFNPEVDMVNPVFKLGMLFGTVQELRAAIREHAIRQRCTIKFAKNEAGCPWKVSGRWMKGLQAMQIRGLVDQHTCVRETRVRWVTYFYLARRFLDRFNDDPNLSLKSFDAIVRREIGVEVSKSKLYRVRARAKQILEGEGKVQYGMFWDYAAEIHLQMPGSTVALVPRSMLFDRMFVSFGPCKTGFLGHCRPLLFVDGCHIKTSYGGQILTAVGIDPNDCIYPIAMAVVEVEDRETWNWFLELVKSVLNILNPSAWTLMSDRQKGVINAVQEQFSGAEHRFCVRHLYQNFLALYKGVELKRLIWAIAKASYPEAYEALMLEMKEKCSDAWQWLSEIPPHQWSRSHFREFPKCDVLMNNLSECFNKYILDARGKSLLTMFEEIRRQIMIGIVRKKDEATKFAERGSLL